MKLKSTTGDINSDPPRRRSITLSFLNDNVEFWLDDNYHVSFTCATWPDLVLQVETKQLHRWQDEEYRVPPIGNGDFKAFLQQINTTPLYQLFLSIIEISQSITFVGSTDILQVQNRLHGLEGRYFGTEGDPGLFFLEAELNSNNTLHQQLLFLVRNNKLCELTLIDNEDNNRLTIFYKPYNTPVDFVINPVDASITNLWNEIRERIYTIIRER